MSCWVVPTLAAELWGIALHQVLDQILCYGKRLLAKRIGLGEVHDRAPAQAPTEFGLACLERHVARLPAWP